MGSFGRACDQRHAVFKRPRSLSVQGASHSCRSSRCLPDPEALGEGRSGRLPEVIADILDTAHAVPGRYQDVQLDLADAVTVAFAAEFSSARTSSMILFPRR